MIDVIAASVKDAITANCDADAGARLSKCVPMLTAAIEDWRNSSHPAPPGDVMLGAATPAGGILAHFANWPAVDEIAGRFEPPDIAAAVLEAIEGNACDVVIGGMAVLLGRAGIANHRSDALRIIRSGRRPLNVLLVEREGGRCSAVMALAYSHGQTTILFACGIPIQPNRSDAPCAMRVL